MISESGAATDTDAVAISRLHVAKLPDDLLWDPP